MTAQEFLKKTLKGWEKLFDGIKLKYAYDAVTEYHIVEVEPENIHRGSVYYKNVEMQLLIDFMEQYPNECLLVCAPSETNDMTNVLYETKVMKLIDKDKIVAEIERLQDATMDENTNFYSVKAQAEFNVLSDLENFIDTLECKDIDLEKEINEHIDECLDVKFPTTNIELIKRDVEYTARKFFELGLKAQKGE